MARFFRNSPLFAFLLLLASHWQAGATHIVGGEMNYRCLGDDEYEITLTIYRDCFYGNPDAYFDDPASIGIFDVNNQLIQQILVPLMGDDTLSPILTNECLVIPPDVCVHTTTYRTIVELPPIIGGYQLAYQRCCRNQTIVNIINPLATGATYGVRITEKALLECNSSPQFLQWPPLYICADEPIVFDQSAFDADGDSIVYRLCTPWQGANPDVPRPQPPNNPPYNEVVWVDPPYDVENMLNGSAGGIPLQINQETGLLTGVPNTVGQFVVGICVEEYRDGELISTTRRDFQYNVGICGQTTAAFSAPAVQCGNLQVEFVNESAGASDFLWHFGDPANPAGSSMETNPSYTYADTGRFEVILIAAPGETCADTFVQEVYLQYNSILPDFSLDTLSCGDSLVVSITDFSTDTISTIESWEWLINGEPAASGPSPLLTFTEPGSNTLDLILSSANGCSWQQTNIIEADFLQVNLATDTVLLCPGTSRFLNPDFNPDYEYQWSPTNFLSDPSAPNPLASPEETISYSLQVTDPTSACFGERQITLVVVEPLTLDLGPDITTCADSVTLNANSNFAVRIFWSEDPGFVNILDDGDSFTVGAYGQTTYYAIALDAAGCQREDSVTVNNQAVNIVALQQDTAICLGQGLSIGLENLDTTDSLVFNWMPEELIESGAGTNEIQILPEQSGPQTLLFDISNQFGCTFRDSLQVIVLDTTDQSATLDYVQCGGEHVYFSSSSVNAPLFQWGFGDPSQPQAVAFGSAVNHTYSAPGNYEVRITMPSAVACPDTLVLPVVVGESVVELDFSWDYTSCSGSAEILLQSESSNVVSEIIGWQWLIGQDMAFEGELVHLTISESSILPVVLEVTSANGCVDTLIDLLNVRLIDLSVADSIQICPGTSAPLNSAGNQTFEYIWSPAEALSDPEAANPFASPVTSMLYSVTVTDPASICEETASVFVQVPADFDYELTADSAFCSNEAELFVLSDTDVEVIWATDQNFTQVISLQPSFTASVGAQSRFYVQLTDTFGCQKTDEVLLDNQSVQVLLEPTVTLCIGDTIQLNAVSVGAYPVTDFSWEPVEAILSGANTASPLVNPRVPTVFELTATNEAGCSLDTSVSVNIFNFVPPLSVMPTRDTINLGESLVLQATVNESYTYLWTPGEFLDATDLPDPIAMPDSTTSFLLTVRDGNGCINTAEVLLVVLNPLCQEPYIFIPNAFTPNGDNLNDVLVVEGNLIEEVYLAIYDRWGELVFESRSKEQGWDGTFRGKELPADSYGYLLEVRCIGGEEYFRKGNITLLR